MKRFLLLVILSIVAGTTCNIPAEASVFSLRSEKQQQLQLEKTYKKEITELFAKLNEYAKNYDIQSLQGLYSSKFVDNDGYTKDVYFSLVEDTWETYPNITYTTKIKDIKIDGNYATVETEESAVATSDDLSKDLFGELQSSSKCIYNLQRFSHKWEIISEIVLEETSTLKYGEARYVKMYLESPKTIGAGQEYTSTLKVDLPSDQIVIGSINQERIVNPATKSVEIYRRLEDQTLTRMFQANSDNINEYNVASVGITASEPAGDDKVRVYMNGLAFIMTRVNVVPKNNFAKVDKKTNKNVEEKI